MHLVGKVATHDTYSLLIVIPLMTIQAAEGSIVRQLMIVSHLSIVRAFRKQPYQTDLCSDFNFHTKTSGENSRQSVLRATPYSRLEHSEGLRHNIPVREARETIPYWPPSSRWAHSKLLSFRRHLIGIRPLVSPVHYVAE